MTEMTTIVQHQKSTRSIFSKAMPSAYVEFSVLPDTRNRIKFFVGWLDQTIISQGISGLERFWMVKHAPTISILQADAQYLDQLHILQRWYAFRSERTEILRFLEKYPFLVSLLVEAYYNIVTYVPHSLVYLDVITDPEEFGAEQLIAFIATDLDPDEATNALSYFDKKWWLNSLQRAQGKLCITLEFQ